MTLCVGRNPSLGYHESELLRENLFEELCSACTLAESRKVFLDGLQEAELTVSNLRKLQRSEPAVEALNPNSWSYARSWKRDENLYIHGPNGTGKSFMARHLLKKVAYGFEDVAETNMRTLPAMFRRFDQGGGIVDTWKRVPVLLIDDLDKVMSDKNSLPALFDVLDVRHAGSGRSARRTIFTSNIPLTSLYSLWRRDSQDNTSFVDGIFDRINPCKSLLLDGKSHRPRFDPGASGL